MVFLMEIMVFGCITGIVKTTVQFNGQSVLPETPPPQSPLNRGFTVLLNTYYQASRLSG
jgi:hypothetical protein